MKKNNIVPFDLELAKKIQEGKENGKLITRDGRDARIIYWDAKNSDYPLIALVLECEETGEVPYNYTAKGHCYLCEEDFMDLMIQLSSNPTKSTKAPSELSSKNSTKEFSPFDKVLVRSSENEIWKPKLFAYISKVTVYNYVCTDNISYKYCIAYNENTKHLVGTTQNYKN